MMTGKLPSSPTPAPRASIAPAKIVILIRSSDPAILGKIARRFRMEYGIASEADAERARWIALAPPTDAGQLAAIQNHAMRVEALYETGAVEITAGYVDPAKVVRAARGDGPGRIYLSRGIWGEIAARKDRGGKFVPAGDSDPEWHARGAMEFFGSLTMER
ncbi:DUF4416 family protein [Candidatus Sumerlaeota bacterium]|nr:DUF4416 family protein [Candidatus Sumerlaeota bacterium]